MFSFHKPKVYRSTTGCCICKAKSSSSRFTDSKKYEDDFVQCFQLSEKRCGEVCNACVLLVKRWKKLPQGNSRNWRHVVDARAGPGTKSMTKFKLKSAPSRPKVKRKSHDEDYDEPIDKKFKRDHSPGSDEVNGDDGSEESPDGSRSPSPSEERIDVLNKRLPPLPSAVSSFVDLSIWKREEICCGTVFVGPAGALIVDPRFIKPCAAWQDCCLKGGTSRTSATPSAQPTHSDSSSDSGYDESSNPAQPIIRTPIPAN